MPTNSDIVSSDFRETEKKRITSDAASQRSEYFSFSLFLRMSSTTEKTMDTATRVANKITMSMIYLLGALIMSIIIASSTFII